MKRSGRASFHLCRLLLGLFFLYAGMLKITDVQAFAGQIAAYELLPYAWNYVVAAILPWIEVACGLLILLNRRVRPAALAVGGMTGVFILVLLTAILRGLEIDCGCFGPTVQSTPQQALLRNVFVLALAHYVFHLHNRYRDEGDDNRDDDEQRLQDAEG